MTYPVTKTEKYRCDGDIITIEFSDTVDCFAFRMNVNDVKGEWLHGGYRGRDEVTNGHYAYFSEYWTGYFPINQVVKLVPCEKVSWDVAYTSTD